MEPREFHWPMSAIYSKFFAEAMEPAYTEVARKTFIPQRAETLLDIGGADGRLALALARQHPHIPRIITADISHDLVKRARSKAEQCGLGRRVESEVQDVHNLNYTNDYFDIVMSFGSMHHWRDPVKALHELCRVLKPEGRMLIYDGHDRPSFKDMRKAVSSIEGSSVWTALAYWMGSRDFLPKTKIVQIVRDSGIKFISVSWDGPACLIEGVKE